MLRDNFFLDITCDKPVIGKRGIMGSYLTIWLTNFLDKPICWDNMFMRSTNSGTRFPQYI